MEFFKWIKSKHIKLQKNDWIKWLEKDLLVYGRGGEVGVKGDKIRQQNGQIHEFD